MWAVASLVFADVYSYPDQGSEPLARGGAWVARATDPIALARNPAGLAGQARGVSAGWDLAVRHHCFTRVKAENDPTLDGVAPGAAYPRVCDDGAAIPVGFAALVLPLSPRLALGVGLVTPSGVPRISFPSGPDAPQRYLLLESTTAMAIPTLGLAYEVHPHIRIGASLGWGIAWVRTTAAAPQVIAGTIRPADVDATVTANAVDAFVPRATLGAHWEASSRVELGASASWSDAIDGTGSVHTVAAGLRGYTPDVAHLTIALPAAAQLGVRVRFPRTSGRDPLHAENGDVELDAMWSNDSAIDAIGLRFPPNIHVVGTPGSLAPNADSARRYRDTVGFRLGGDYVLVPDRFALRAGAFFTPRAAEPGFSGLEAMAGQRIGLAAGATIRVNTFDLSIAYMHMFVADLGSTTDGIHAAAGQASPGASARTPWPIGLGSSEDALDVIHAGIAYRFPD